MKKENLKNDRYILGILLIIFLSSMVLAGSRSFAVQAVLGIAVMIMAAFLPFEVLQEKSPGIRTMAERFDTPIGCGIGCVSVIFWKAVKLWQKKQQWQVFLSKEGEAAYIYSVLSQFRTQSKWLGGAFESEEITAFLPEYGQTCLLTCYMAKYGKLVVFGILFLLGLLFVLVLKRAVRTKMSGRFLVVFIVSFFVCETAAEVFLNLEWIPFVSNGAFLPFYSQEMTNIVCSYTGMGLVLNVCRRH